MTDLNQQEIQTQDDISASFERTYRRNRLDNGITAQWAREAAEASQEPQEVQDQTVGGQVMDAPDKAQPEPQAAQQTDTEQPGKVALVVNKPPSEWFPDATPEVDQNPNWWSAFARKTGSVISEIGFESRLAVSDSPENSSKKVESFIEDEKQMSAFGEISRPVYEIQPRAVQEPYKDPSKDIVIAKTLSGKKFLKTYEDELFEGAGNLRTAEESLDAMDIALKEWPINRYEEEVIQAAIQIEKLYKDYVDTTDFPTRRGFLAGLEGTKYSKEFVEEVGSSWQEIYQKNVLQIETQIQDEIFLTPTIREAFREKYGKEVATKIEYWGQQYVDLMGEGKTKDEIDKLLFGPKIPVDFPLWDPLIDIPIDIAFGGYSALKRAGWRTMTGPVAKKLASIPKGAATKEILASVGFGALAGGSMTVVDAYLSNDMLTMLSGVIGPVATYGIFQLSRRGLATALNNFSRNNPEVYTSVLDAARKHPEAPLSRAILDEETEYIRLALQGKWNEIPDDVLVKYPNLYDMVSEIKYGVAEAWGIPGAKNPMTMSAARNIITKSGNEALEAISEFESKAIAGTLTGADKDAVSFAYAKYAVISEQVKKGPAKELLAESGLMPEFQGIPITELGETLNKFMLQNKILSAQETFYVGLAAKGLVNDIPESALKSNPRLAALIQEIQGQQKVLSTLGLSQEAVRAPLFDADKKKAKQLDRAAGEILTGLNRFERTLFVPGDNRLPKYAGSVNLARIHSTNDVKRLLLDISQSFEKEITAARRGVVSHQDTEELATLLGMTPEQLILRPIGRAGNAHEIMAATALLKTSAEAFVDVAKAYHMRVSQGMTPSDADAFQVKRMMAILELVQQECSGMATEAGRALGIYNNPNLKDARAQYDQIAKVMSETKFVDDKLAQLCKMISQSGIDNPMSLLNSAAMLHKPKITDHLLKYYISGLLMAPSTHVVNAVTNTMFYGWQAVETTLAAGISSLRGGNTISPKDLGNYYYASVNGFLGAIKACAKSFKTMEPLFETSKAELAQFGRVSGSSLATAMGEGPTKSALERGNAFSGAINMLDNAFTMSTRVLGASDAFSKAMSFNRELHFQASRQATQKGLIGKEHAEYMHKVISNPEKYAPELWHKAVDVAKYSTFTDELGPTGKNIMAITQNNPFLKLFFPFIRTPTNLVKRSLERTPLALLSENVRETIAKGGFEADLTMSRIALGSYVMMSAYTFVESGQITGRGPIDRAEREHLKELGWLPYSFKWGDTYYQADRLDPFVFMFFMAADTAEFMKSDYIPDEMKEELAYAMVLSFFENTLSKTYLQKLTEVLDAISETENTGPIERSVRSLLSSFVPRIVPKIADEIERGEIVGWATGDEPQPVGRKAVYDLMDEMKNTLGIRGDLPPNRNMWGKESYKPETLGPSLLSPIGKSKDRVSPIDSELLRLHMPIRKPPQKQSFSLGPNAPSVEIELSPQEYDKYVKLAMIELPTKVWGKPMQEYLSDEVSKEAYEKLPDIHKKTFIANRLNRMRGLARRELLNSKEGSGLLERVRLEAMKKGFEGRDVSWEEADFPIGRITGFKVP